MIIFENQQKISISRRVYNISATAYKNNVSFVRCVRHVFKPMLRNKYPLPLAQFVVFLLSALFHEYLVSVPLRVFKAYAFMGMLLQVEIHKFITVQVHILLELIMLLVFIEPIRNVYLKKLLLQIVLKRLQQC